MNDLCIELEKNYIFPDIAKKCSEHLRHQLQEGVYNLISDVGTLTQALTADLRLISEDKHITVFFNPQKQPSNVSSTEGENPEKLESSLKVQERPTLPTDPALENTYVFVVEETPKFISHEIRSGLLVDNPSVGYLEMLGFGPCKQDESYTDEINKNIDMRRHAIVDAVQNIKEAETIIIDMRHNGGGAPSGVQFLCSLFMEENFPLNRIQWRKGDEFIMQDFNTLQHNELPADERLLNSPVFILIGPHTFSAAEEFSNNMKVLGRATLIGEPSGGGANPGREFQAGDLSIFIPTGQAINPIEEGNWEGVGIIPDHMVREDNAMDFVLNLINLEK